MIEIAVYGRKGQGVFSASKCLAKAFDFQGINSVVFPSFESWMVGSPVTCFVRASRKVIETKSPIILADYSLVLDSSLIVSEKVVEKTKARGTIIVNTAKELEISREHRVICVDINQGAKDFFPKSVNIGLLGAYAGATRILQLKNLVSSISELFPEDFDKNSRIAEKIYELVRRELT